MKEQEKHDVFKEEVVTFKQIVAGKLSFLITIAYFMMEVPGDEYLKYFGYTLIPLSVLGTLFKLKLIRDDLRILSLYVITGYGSAMWILAMTQAFNR